MCKEKKKDLIADLENSSNQYALVESMLTRQDELLKRFTCLTFCRKLILLHRPTVLHCQALLSTRLYIGIH